MDVKTEQQIYTEKRINPSLAEYERVFGINVLKEFSGRKILDLGSKDDRFAKAVKAVYPNLDTDITSLDHNDLEKSVIARSRRVKAKAQFLPFKGEVFDVVLAHFSVPFWLPGLDKNLTDNEKLVGEMESVLDEVSRVLGPGGEALFSPWGLALGAIPEINQSDAEDEFTSKLVERINTKTDKKIRFSLESDGFGYTMGRLVKY